MRAFTHLSEAVRLLAEALDSGDDAALAAVSREPLPEEWVLKRLRERHQATPLPDLYAGREFPADADTFKLGGHDAELGHLDLDFVRTEGGWELERIWMCR
jgi:hypothetical protein